MSTGNTGKPVIEILIRDRAPELADQIRKAAKWAQSEADLQHEVEKQLDSFRAEAGIKKDQFDTSHQNVTIGKSGRPDSRYQTFFIEYKNPTGGGYYKKKDSPNYATALKQITDRFDDLVSHENRKKEHIFGVGLDGHDFIFVRWQRNDWDVRFQEVNDVSAEHFLRKLVDLAAHGRSFTPEQLAGDFGSEADVASDAIHHFYEAIIRTQNPRARTFFEQWKILFGEVCGYDVTSLSDKLKKLAKFYLKLETCRPAELMFAVHTYFALFMKLLAGQIVSAFLDPGGMTGNALANLQGATTAAALKVELEKIESGGIFRDFARITNFLEGDLFAWYLDVWDEDLKANFGKLEIPRVVRDVIDKLDGYDLTTLSVEPEETRDLLKHLYQNLFPKTVRHDLGEYYTPDWLAEHVLNEVGFDGDPDKRVLDPACGSGTFLVLTIARIIEHEQKLQRPLDANLLKKITANVIGFDLNPLAVMASRVNYLLALRALLRKHPPFEIPVYLCDSILTPSTYGQMTLGQEASHLPLETSAKRFLIPVEISKPRDVLGKYADALEFCIKHDYAPADFLEYCRKQKGLDITKDELHAGLYNDLCELERQGKNGIWARIIKNSFAPLFVERVDYVVGNPPWVNLDAIPMNYREALFTLNQKVYDLFKHKGIKARLGSSEIDVSTLFVYVSMDKYLKLDGRLSFVITQTVFQSTASNGFRKFRLPDDTPFAVESVADMVDVQPFEGATNRTAVFTAQRHGQTKYPVTYKRWRPKSTISPGSSLELVMKRVVIDDLAAEPVASDDTLSPWSALPVGLLGLKRQPTRATYTAHVGVHTFGANGIYWVNPIRTSEGHSYIQNETKGAKNKVPIKESTVETTRIWPLARGRDLIRWYVKPTMYFVHLQSAEDPKHALSMDIARRDYPLTYAWFEYFRHQLEGRVNYKKFLEPVGEPYYALYSFKKYTMAPYKVVWRNITDTFFTAVLSSIKVEGASKVILPDQKLIFVGLEDEQEAHYLSAFLNSAGVRLLVQSYMIATQVTTNAVGYGKAPIYDASEAHKKLSGYSLRAHEVAPLAYAGDKKAQKELGEIEQAIDEAAAELWGITKPELAAIQKALKDMQRPKRKRKGASQEGEDE